MSLWLTIYFLRNILQFSVIIHAALSGNMLYCFFVRDCFYVIWGIKYARSTNVLFFNDISGWTVRCKRM